MQQATDRLGVLGPQGSSFGPQLARAWTQVAGCSTFQAREPWASDCLVARAALQEVRAGSRGPASPEATPASTLSAPWLYSNANFLTYKYVK